MIEELTEEEMCNCPSCTLANKMREILAHGFPPDLLVPMVLDVLATVAGEYGVEVESSVTEERDRVIH